jgi:hypothetical protein
MTSRLIMVGDALSQLFNVAFLRNLKDTTSNESTSGRAHRAGWERTEKLINWLASPFEKDHCRLAYENDVRRAEALVEYDRQRKLLKK